MRLFALIALLLAAALASEIRQKRQFVYTTGFGYPSVYTGLNYGYTGYTGLATYPSYSFASYPSYSYGYPSTYAYTYPSYGTYGSIIVGK